MITDLKPNTQYEFTVKVVKGKRESPWSMVVQNTTFPSAPGTAPRDLTVTPLEDNSQVVKLTWLPPKLSNGPITGIYLFKHMYMRLYVNCMNCFRLYYFLYNR